MIMIKNIMTFLSTNNIIKKENIKWTFLGEKIRNLFTLNGDRL